VIDNLFDVDLGLFTRSETEFLLREDPRITNRVVYYEVLAAAAAGASTPAKIGGYTELLERRQGEQVWNAVAPTFHSQILGPHFEELARDWVRNYAQGEIGVESGAVGTTDIQDTAGRAKHELDVVALSPGEKPRTKNLRIALLGEAKATGRRWGAWPTWNVWSICALSWPPRGTTRRTHDSRSSPSTASRAISWRVPPAATTCISSTSHCSTAKAPDLHDQHAGPCTHRRGPAYFPVPVGQNTNGPGSWAVVAWQVTVTPRYRTDREYASPVAR
jgi:hypothetical protein